MSSPISPTSANRGSSRAKSSALYVACAAGNTGVNADAPRQRVGPRQDPQERAHPVPRRGTVATLRAHRVAQGAERLLLGPGYSQLDRVFLPRGRLAGRTRAGEPALSYAFARGRAPADRASRAAPHPRHPRPAAGVDMTIVSMRLGHAKSSFTADTYTRLLPAVDREAANLVADLADLAARKNAAEQAP